jgi:hypothetical protein
VRAGSAENLETTVHAVDSTALVSDYGEDPAAILAYATTLGLAYAKVKNTYGNKAFESEGERLRGYTERAVALETDMQMSAGYRIYSGAAHAELYSVMRGWRQVTPGTAAPLERWCDREVVWMAVLASPGFAMTPVYRALVLLGLNARIVEMVRSMKDIGKMTRRMKLPPAWAY